MSAHWIRHTTLTWVECNFGFATAHAYAGHFDEADTKNATLTYVTKPASTTWLLPYPR